MLLKALQAGRGTLSHTTLKIQCWGMQSLWHHISNFKWDWWRSQGRGWARGVGQDDVQELLLTLHLFHCGVCIEKRNTESHQIVVYFELFRSCVRSTSCILVEILLRPGVIMASGTGARKRLGDQQPALLEVYAAASSDSVVVAVLKLVCPGYATGRKWETESDFVLHIKWPSQYSMSTLTGSCS